MSTETQHFTLRITQEDGEYRCTEPGANAVGYGETHLDAVDDYVDRCRELREA